MGVGVRGYVPTVVLSGNSAALTQQDLRHTAVVPIIGPDA